MSSDRLSRRVGVTPILLRHAWEYLQKGIGTHYIQHPIYDNVVVEELYPWRILEELGQGSIRVRFNKGNKTVRYVEMACRFSGGGSSEVISEVF